MSPSRPPSTTATRVPERRRKPNHVASTLEIHHGPPDPWERKPPWSSGGGKTCSEIRPSCLVTLLILPRDSEPLLVLPLSQETLARSVRAIPVSTPAVSDAEGGSPRWAFRTGETPHGITTGQSRTDSTTGCPLTYSQYVQQSRPNADSDRKLLVNPFLKQLCYLPESSRVKSQKASERWSQTRESISSLRPALSLRQNNFPEISTQKYLKFIKLSISTNLNFFFSFYF